MRWLALAAVVASGCSDREKPKPATSASEPVDREIFAGGFYRSRDRSATVKAPGPDAVRFRVRLSNAPGGGRRIEARYRGPTEREAQLSISILAPAPAPRDPAALVRTAARAMQRRMSQVAAQGPVKAPLVEGGKAASASYAGRHRGVAVRLDVLAVTEGEHAVILQAWGDALAMAENDFAVELARARSSIRVGDRVAKLPAPRPGTPIEGVYVHSPSPAQHRALVFDPRGYAHQSIPADVFDTDPSLRHQRDPTSIATYSVEHRRITFQRPGHNRRDHALSIGRDRVALDGVTYLRIDGRLRPEAVVGGWRSAQGSTYHFAPTGRFSDRSAAEAHRPGRLDISAGRFGPLGVRTPNPPTHLRASSGAYRVRGDRIQLSYDDASRLEVPAYPYRRLEDGAIDRDKLYIAGALHTRIAD